MPDPSPRVKRAAIIELSSSHVECIHAQQRFLQESGYEPHLICSKRIEERARNFLRPAHLHAFDFGGKFRAYRSLVRIRSLLIGEKFDIAVFNTSGGIDVRDMMFLPYPRSIAFAAILHDTTKLTGSRSQRMINKKIRRYFVLNDYLLPFVSPPDGIRVASFYPIFFPEVDPVPLRKPEGEFWIGIPGSVELQRRDYRLLFDALREGELHPSVRFLLLGQLDTVENMRERVLRELEATGHRDRFIVFEQFMDDRTHHAYTRLCDLILPLAFHEKTPHMASPEHMISGSYLMAFGYRKPLLCHEYFKRNEDFRENAIFYSDDTLRETINALAAGGAEVLREKESTMYRNPKWAFERQRERYISLLAG